MTETIHRRSSLARRSSGRDFEVTLNDVYGFFEPLTRYARLPSNHLTPFDRRYNPLARLTVLYQETEKFPAKDQLLVRSDQRWRYGGMNGQAQYRAGPGIDQYLERYGLLDPLADRWIPSTRIGPHDNDHDLFLNLAVSSIELAARKAPNLAFIDHIEILRGASPAAQAADDPLKIPFRSLNVAGYPSIKEPHLRPDALFGLEYTQGTEKTYRFFAVEFDRGSEPIHPKKDLARSSWLRKIASYNTAYQPILDYFNIPNLWVLCIIPEKPRAQAKDRVKSIMTEAIQPVAGRSSIFCVQTYSPIRNFADISPPTADLLKPWRRFGYPDLNISTPEGT